MTIRLEDHEKTSRIDELIEWGSRNGLDMTSERDVQVAMKSFPRKAPLEPEVDPAALLADPVNPYTAESRAEQAKMEQENEAKKRALGGYQDAKFQAHRQGSISGAAPGIITSPSKEQRINAFIEQAEAAGVDTTSVSEVEAFMKQYSSPGYSSGEVHNDEYFDLLTYSLTGGVLGPAAQFMTGGGASAARAAGESVLKALGSRLKMEVASEAGSLVGMGVASQVAPDSILASLAGGLAGGVGGGLVARKGIRSIGDDIASGAKKASDKLSSRVKDIKNPFADAPPAPKPVGDDVLQDALKRLNNEIIQVDDPAKALELSLATKKTVRDAQGRLYKDGKLLATPGNSQNLTDLAPERPGVIEPAPKATDVPSEQVTPVRSDSEVSTEVPAVQEAPPVAAATPPSAPVESSPGIKTWKMRLLEAIKKNKRKPGSRGLSKGTKKRLEAYGKDLPPGPDDADVLPGAGSWKGTIYPENHPNTVDPNGFPGEKKTKVVPGEPFAPAPEKTAADALTDLLPDAPIQNKPAYSGAGLPSYARVEYTAGEQKAVKAAIIHVLQDVDASNGVDILSKIKNNDGSYEGFFNQMDGEDVFEKLLELISNKAELPRHKVRSILYGLADAEGTTKYGLRTNGSKDTLRDPWVVGILRQADDFDAASRSNPYKGPLIEQGENAADKPAMHKIDGERVPAVDSTVESLGTHHGDKNVYEWFKPLNDNPDFNARYRERPKDGVVPGFFADADTMMTTHDVDVIGPNAAANYLLAREKSGNLDELMETAKHITNTWTEAKVKAMGGLAPDEAVAKQWIESGYGTVQNKAGDLLDISPLMLKEKADMFPGMYEKALEKVAKDLDLPRDYVEYALENLSKKMDTNAATKASLTQFFDPKDPRLQASASEKVARQGAARSSLDAGADIGEGPLPGAMQNAGLTDYGKADLDSRINAGADQRAKLEAEASMYEEAVNAVKVAEALGLNAKESRRLLVESVGARTGLKGDALLNEVEAILRDAKAMDSMGSSGGARKALSDSVAKRTGLSGEELEKEVRGIINDLNAPLSLTGNKKEARRMLIASVESRTGLKGQALRDEVRGILNEAREIPADVRLANNTLVRDPETLGERIMARVAVGKKVDINQLKAYPDSDGLRSSKGAYEALQDLIVADSKAGLKLEDTLIATGENAKTAATPAPRGGTPVSEPVGPGSRPAQALTEAQKAIAAERQTRLREARKIAWNLKNASEIQSYSKISEAMDAVSEPVRRELEELLLEPNFKPHKFVATLENELAISAHAYKNALPGGLTHKEQENVLLRKVVERYGDKPTQGAVQETIDSLPLHLREQLLEIAKSPKAAGGAEKRAIAKMELWKYGKIAYEKTHGKFKGATMGFLGGGFGDADISSVALSFARKFMDIKAGISKKALTKVDEIYHGTDLIKRLGGGEIERLSESFDKATVRKLLHLASNPTRHGALDAMNIPAQTKENLKKMSEMLTPFLQREFGDSDMGHLFDRGYFVRNRHQVKVSPNAASDFIYGMVKDGYFSSSTLDNSVKKAAKLFEELVSGSPRSEGYKKALWELERTLGTSLENSPQYVKAILGNVDDPKLVFSSNLNSLVDRVSQSRTAEAMVDLFTKGDKSVLSYRNKPGMKRIPSETPLVGGMYAPKYLVDRMAADFKDLPKIARMGAHIQTIFKKGKVFYNLGAYPRNAISNSLMSMIGGVPLRYQLGSFKGVISDLQQFSKTGAMSPYLKEAMENGLFSGTATTGDLNAFRKQLSAFDGIGASGMEGFLEGINRRMSTGKIGSLGERAYGFIEDVSRLTAYKYYMEKGIPRGLTESITKGDIPRFGNAKVSPSEAVAEVNKWLFDYSNVPEMVDILRKSAVPFITYPYFATKAIGNAVKNGNVGLISALAMASGVQKAIESQTGEHLNLDPIFPLWSVFTDGDDQRFGKSTTSELTGVPNRAGELMDSFLPGGPAALIPEVGANYSLFKGKEIGGAKEKALHAAETMLPRTPMSIAKYLTGNRELSTRNVLSDLGFSFSKNTPERAQWQYGTQIKDEIAAYRRFEARNKDNPQLVAKRKAQADKRIAQLQEKLAVASGRK